MNINVLYEDNHVLVVEKPINVPTQEDDSKDKDLLTILKEYIKEKYNKPGNVYLGLVHRLDRPVGGVMVFAKTSKAASRLSDQIRLNKFNKVYNAVCLGNVNNEGRLEDKLLKDTKRNIVKVDPNGKQSILNYKKLKQKDNLTLVEIKLETGRPHQIRVQFSSRNHPLFGDQRYGQDVNKKGDQISLWSYKLEIVHPTTKEKMEFICEPPNKYPWNLFEV